MEDMEECSAFQTTLDGITQIPKPKGGTLNDDAETPRLEHLIIDSGAIIKGFVQHSIAKELWTVPQVIDEIKDRKSKRNIPFNLKTRTPSGKALQDIKEFAEKTGDLSRLSYVDLLVLALTLELHREYDDEALIHLDVELPVSYIQPTEVDGVEGYHGGDSNVFLDAEDRTSVSDESIDKTQVEKEENVEDEDGEGEFVPVKRKCKGKRRKRRHKWPGESQWITPDNVDEISKELNGISGSDDVRVAKVGCVTTDFTMQNTMLHAGLHLLSLEGFRITHVKRWAKKCSGCQEIVDDTDKAFCPKCGHDTLLRISYSIDSSGQRRYFLKRNFKVNLKGSKYTVPSFQRSKKNIVLSEDEIEIAKLRRERKGQDVSDIDYEFFKAENSQSKAAEPVAGYGRRNPNVSHKRLGKKKKGRH